MYYEIDPWGTIGPRRSLRKFIIRFILFLERHFPPNMVESPFSI